MWQPESENGDACVKWLFLGMFSAWLGGGRRKIRVSEASAMRETKVRPYFTIHCNIPMKFKFSRLDD